MFMNNFFRELCPLYLGGRYVYNWIHRMGHFSCVWVRHSLVSKFLVLVHDLMKNKLLRGREKSCASSLRSRLFIKPGLAAFPSRSDLRVD